jgi:hypothetical protein
MKMCLPDVAAGDKNLFNDYGQKWDRQSLRKDFDLKKTKKHVPIITKEVYNNEI